jgi:4-amino-4-deoxy-L-arabinose transferase-like glycosyltransferase
VSQLAGAGSPEGGVPSVTAGESACGQDLRRDGTALLGGLLFGGAILTNYLAVFVTIAAIVGVAAACPRSRASQRSATLMLLGVTLALPPAAWFYLAQRGSRAGQFPPFELFPSLARLAQYSAAGFSGGLPLYVGTSLRPCVSTALAGGLMVLVALIACRWGRIGQPAARRLLLLCAMAPAAGLLALGMAFSTTPIELRYLTFGIPFAVLLLTGALGTLRPGIRHPITAVILIVQSLAIAGLMTRPETMQPARATAQAAAAAAGVGDSIVLVPFGNDGVGIVGAFANEAPASLRLLIVRRTDTPAEILARTAPYRRIVIALLAQDADSRATLPLLTGMFAGPGWRQLAGGSTVLAYDSTCQGAPDVLRGLHHRQDRPSTWPDPAAPWRIRTAAGPAAREPADPCDVASGGADPGQTLHGDLP